MKSKPPPSHLTAAEAAAELGISRASLYAYVSRGLIRSAPEGGRDPRRRLYETADIRELVRRRHEARTAGQAAEHALHWGLPVLESAITAIEEGRFYYRGRDVLRLAAEASLETVAGLIWDVDSDPFDQTWPSSPVTDEGLSGLARMTIALARAGASDPMAHSRSGPAAAQTGARIVRLMAASAGTDPQTASREPIHAALARRLGRLDRAAAELIRIALILTVDHELNASTFAVRVAASTKANLYQAVSAGLAAFQGPRHGGAQERSVALLAEAEATSPEEVVATRLRRGENLPGFGHPLYPEGDPRAQFLIARLAKALPRDPAVLLAQRLVGAAKSQGAGAPNIDLALAALGRALALPADGGTTVFAVGRTVGWIGHALEQYTDRRLIRPRARYVGLPPRRFMVNDLQAVGESGKVAPTR
ncbi:MAG: helix-turn-helix domain-containing protein, partial [Alphaproteobacteria bacterium]|nr:helix-turn-helix domain-containing protein [Alphaproteobacteria bacterium]